MAVFDKMDSFDQGESLQEGFVFVSDIIARAYSVTSMCIEDTVVIAKNGCEILSKGLPRTVKETKTFMKNKIPT